MPESSRLLSTTSWSSYETSMPGGTRPLLHKLQVWQDRLLSDDKLVRIWVGISQWLGLLHLLIVYSLVGICQRVNETWLQLRGRNSMTLLTSILDVVHYFRLPHVLYIILLQTFTGKLNCYCTISP